VGEREKCAVGEKKEKKVKGIGLYAGRVDELKKKKKNLNCSLLNYSHVSREPNFGKTLGILSTPLLLFL
jgi:hypothetical protein